MSALLLYCKHEHRYERGRGNSSDVQSADSRYQLISAHHLGVGSCLSRLFASQSKFRL